MTFHNCISPRTHSIIERMYSEIKPCYHAASLRTLARDIAHVNPIEAVAVAKLSLGVDRHEGIQAFAELALLYTDLNPPLARDLVMRALYICRAFKMHNELLLNISAKISKL